MDKRVVTGVQTSDKVTQRGRGKRASPRSVVSPRVVQCSSLPPRHVVNSDDSATLDDGDPDNCPSVAPRAPRGGRRKRGQGRNNVTPTGISPVDCPSPARKCSPRKSLQKAAGKNRLCAQTVEVDKDLHKSAASVNLTSDLTSHDTRHSPVRAYIKVAVARKGTRQSPRGQLKLVDVVGKWDMGVPEQGLNNQKEGCVSSMKKPAQYTAEVDTLVSGDGTAMVTKDLESGVDLVILGCDKSNDPVLSTKMHRGEGDGCILPPDGTTKTRQPSPRGRQSSRRGRGRGRHGTPPVSRHDVLEVTECVGRGNRAGRVKRAQIAKVLSRGGLKKAVSSQGYLEDIVAISQSQSSLSLTEAAKEGVTMSADTPAVAGHLKQTDQHLDTRCTGHVLALTKVIPTERLLQKASPCAVMVSAAPVTSSVMVCASPVMVSASPVTSTVMVPASPVTSSVMVSASPVTSPVMVSASPVMSSVAVTTSPAMVSSSNHSVNARLKTHVKVNTKHVRQANSRPRTDTGSIHMSRLSPETVVHLKGASRKGAKGEGTTRSSHFSQHKHVKSYFGDIDHEEDFEPDYEEEDEHAGIGGGSHDTVVDTKDGGEGTDVDPRCVTMCHSPGDTLVTLGDTELTGDCDVELGDTELTLDTECNDTELILDSGLNDTDLSVDFERDSRQVLCVEAPQLVTDDESRDVSMTVDGDDSMTDYCGQEYDSSEYVVVEVEEIADRGGLCTVMHEVATDVIDTVTQDRHRCVYVDDVGLDTDHLVVSIDNTGLVMDRCHESTEEIHSDSVNGNDRACSMGRSISLLRKIEHSEVDADPMGDGHGTSRDGQNTVQCIGVELGSKQRQGTARVSSVKLSTDGDATGRVHTDRRGSEDGHSETSSTSSQSIPLSLTMQQPQGKVRKRSWKRHAEKPQVMEDGGKKTKITLRRPDRVASPAGRLGGINLLSSQTVTQAKDSQQPNCTTAVTLKQIVKGHTVVMATDLAKESRSRRSVICSGQKASLVVMQSSSGREKGCVPGVTKTDTQTPRETVTRVSTTPVTSGLGCLPPNMVSMSRRNFSVYNSTIIVNSDSDVSDTPDAQVVNKTCVGRSPVVMTTRVPCMKVVGQGNLGEKTSTVGLPGRAPLKIPPVGKVLTATLGCQNYGGPSSVKEEPSSPLVNPSNRTIILKDSGNSISDKSSLYGSKVKGSSGECQADLASTLVGRLNKMASTKVVARSRGVVVDHRVAVCNERTRTVPNLRINRSPEILSMCNAAVSGRQEKCAKTLTQAAPGVRRTVQTADTAARTDVQTAARTDTQAQSVRKIVRSGTEISSDHPPGTTCQAQRNTPADSRTNTGVRTTIRTDPIRTSEGHVASVPDAGDLPNSAGGQTTTSTGNGILLHPVVKGPVAGGNTRPAVRCRTRVTTYSSGRSAGRPLMSSNIIKMISMGIHPRNDDHSVDSGTAQVQHLGRTQVQGSEETQVQSLKKAKLQSSETTQVQSSEKTQVQSEEKMQVPSSQKALAESSEMTQVHSSELTNVHSSKKMQIQSLEKAQVHSSEKTNVHSSEKMQIQSSEMTQVHGSEMTNVHCSKKMQIQSSEMTQVHGSEMTNVHCSKKMQIQSSEMTQVHGSEMTNVHCSKKMQIQSSEMTQVHSSEMTNVHSSKKMQIQSSEKAQAHSSETTNVHSSEKMQEQSSEKAEVQTSEMTNVQCSGKTQVQNAEMAQVRRLVEKTKVQNLEKTQEMSSNLPLQPSMSSAGTATVVAEQFMSATLVQVKRDSDEGEKSTQDSHLPSGDRTERVSTIIDQQKEKIWKVWKSRFQSSAPAAAVLPGKTPDGAAVSQGGHLVVNAESTVSSNSVVPVSSPDTDIKLERQQWTNKDTGDTSSDASKHIKSDTSFLHGDKIKEECVAESRTLHVEEIANLPRDLSSDLSTPISAHSNLSSETVSPSKRRADGAEPSHWPDEHPSKMMRLSVDADSHQVAGSNQHYSVSGNSYMRTLQTCLGANTTDRGLWDSLALVFRKLLGRYRAIWMEHLDTMVKVIAKDMDELTDRLDQFLFALQRTNIEVSPRLFTDYLGRIGAGLVDQCVHGAREEHVYGIIKHLHTRSTHLYPYQGSSDRYFLVAKATLDACLQHGDVDLLKKILEENGWLYRNSSMCRRMQLRVCNSTLWQIFQLLRESSLRGKVPYIIEMFTLAQFLFVTLCLDSVEDAETLPDYKELIDLSVIFDELLHVAMEKKVPQLLLEVYSCCISLTTKEIVEMRLCTHRDIVLFLYAHRQFDATSFQEAVRVANHATVCGLYPEQPKPQATGSTIRLWTCMSQQEMYLVTYAYFQELKQKLHSIRLTSGAIYNVHIVLEKLPDEPRYENLFGTITGTVKVHQHRVEQMAHKDFDPPLSGIWLQSNLFKLDSASVETYLTHTRSGTANMVAQPGAVLSKHSSSVTFNKNTPVDNSLELSSGASSSFTRNVLPPSMSHLNQPTVAANQVYGASSFGRSVPPRSVSPENQLTPATSVTRSYSGLSPVTRQPSDAPLPKEGASTSGMSSQDNKSYRRRTHWSQPSLLSVLPPGDFSDPSPAIVLARQHSTPGSATKRLQTAAAFEHDRQLNPKRRQLGESLSATPQAQYSNTNDVLASYNTDVSVSYNTDMSASYNSDVLALYSAEVSTSYNSDVSASYNADAGDTWQSRDTYTESQSVDANMMSSLKQSNRANNSREVDSKVGKSWTAESRGDKNWGTESKGDKKWGTEIRGDKNWVAESKGDKNWGTEIRGVRNWGTEIRDLKSSHNRIIYPGTGYTESYPSVNQGTDTSSRGNEGSYPTANCVTDFNGRGDRGSSCASRGTHIDSGVGKPYPTTRWSTDAKKFSNPTRRWGGVKNSLSETSCYPQTKWGADTNTWGEKSSNTVTKWGADTSDESETSCYPATRWGDTNSRGEKSRYPAASWCADAEIQGERSSYQTERWDTRTLSRGSADNQLSGHDPGREPGAKGTRLRNVYSGSSISDSVRTPPVQRSTSGQGMPGLGRVHSQPPSGDSGHREVTTKVLEAVCDRLQFHVRQGNLTEEKCEIVSGGIVAKFCEKYVTDCLEFSDELFNTLVEFVDDKVTILQS